MPSDAERSPQRWPRWPQSLSGRLLLAYLGAWLATVALVAAGITAFLHADPSRWHDHSTLTLAQELAAQARPGSAGSAGSPPSVGLPAGVSWLADAAPLDIGHRLIDARGQVRHWSSPQVREAWSEAGLAARPEPGQGRAVVRGLPLRLRTVAVDGLGEPMWLEVGVSDRLIALAHTGTATRLGRTIGATVAVSIVLLGVVHVLVLRRLLRPVRRLSAQARQLSVDRQGARLDAAGVPLEIQPLVASFNEALQRLEQAFARQLQFLADAAHELKTPLALLRLQVELGPADRQAQLRDIDQLSRQVQQMLMLAEVTEPRSYRDDPIDPTAIASEVCRLLEPMASRHRVRLEIRGPAEEAPLRGDRASLQVLLKNLVENAIGFAPRGTAVCVEIEPHRVRISDRGAGIAEEHLPHLFTRFWRAPGRRDHGAGLGLAICQAVAQAHGWRMAVRNLDPGAEFTLSFETAAPTAPAAPA